jgi:hypothetical protein
MKVVALILALYAGFPLLELDGNTTRPPGQWAKYLLVKPI